MVKLPPRIKVFRTRIGFHDWVVATSSKQAALKAWDVTADLFAAGQAEVTDDPAAIKLALSHIGKAVAAPNRGATKRAKPKQGSGARVGKSKSTR